MGYGGILARMFEILERNRTFARDDCASRHPMADDQAQTYGYKLIYNV